MYESKKKGYIMKAGISVDIFNLDIEGVGLSTGKGIEKVVRLRNL